MEYNKIAADHINQDDRLFFVQNDVASDINSLNIQDLYNPIWLQKKKDDEYRIVDGFIITPRALKNPKIKRLPARVFESDFDIEALWLLRMQKRLSENNLAPIALIQSLITILNTIDKQEPSQDVSLWITRQGFPAKGLSQNQLSETMNILESRCQFCDLHALTYREIYSISRRKQEELTAFSTLFADLSLKGNKLHSMLQLLDELAKGYQLSPEEVVTKEETLKILNQCPRHLKYKTLKAYLSTLRWPVLDRTQKKWQQSVKKFNLPGKLTITTDSMFESNELDFNFKVSNIAEYSEMISTLKSYSSSAEFAGLFDFI